MLSKKTVLQWKNDVLKLNVYATLVLFMVFRKTKNNFQGVQVSQITLNMQQMENKFVDINQSYVNIYLKLKIRWQKANLNM